MSIGRILTLVGVIVTLVCLFLPWVTLANAGTVTGLLPPEAQALLRGTISEYSSFSGWRFLSGRPNTSLILRLLVLLAAVGAVVGLVNVVFSMLSPGWGSQLLDSAQAVLAVLGVIALAVGTTTVERLGQGRDGVWAVAFTLLGSRLDLGFWGTMLGLALTAAGGFLSARESAWGRVRV